LRFNLLVFSLLISIFGSGFYPTNVKAFSIEVLRIIWRYGEANVSPNQSLKIRDKVRTGNEGKVFGLEPLSDAKITVNPYSVASVVTSEKRKNGSVNVVMVVESGSAKINVPPFNNKASSFWTVSPHQGLRRQATANYCYFLIWEPCPAFALEPKLPENYTKLNTYGAGTVVNIDESVERIVGVEKGSISEYAAGAKVDVSAGQYTHYRAGQQPSAPMQADRRLAAYKGQTFQDGSLEVWVAPGNKIIHKTEDKGSKAVIALNETFNVQNPLGAALRYLVVSQSAHRGAFRSRALMAPTVLSKMETL
jgi:hypothetical protein